MRVFPYLIGAFVSLFAGFAIGWLSGSFGLGVVASLFVFLVAAYLIWDRREHGDDAGSPRGKEVRNAGAYPHAVHGGGHSDGGGGFDGGGGGCDGGDGGGF